MVSGERARRMSQLQELQAAAAALMSRMAATPGPGSDMGSLHTTLAITATPAARGSCDLTSSNAWAAAGSAGMFGGGAAVPAGGVEGWGTPSTCPPAHPSSSPPGMAAGLASKQQQFTLMQQQQQQLGQPQGWLLPAAPGAGPMAGWGPSVPGAMGYHM